MAASERLAGKTVIVTGASHGIGKATAQLMAAQGATVLLADRDAEAGEQVRSLLAGQGHDVTFVETDVSNEDDIERMIAAGAELGNGKLHGLVNVAGVDIIAKLEDHSAARFDRVIAVNLRSMFLSCKYAIPHLRAAGHSSIVNVSSIQAARGFSGYPGYAATKGGIISFSQQIAIDYAADGIRVNVVSPGPVVTDLATTSAKLEPDFPALGPAGSPDIAAEPFGAETPVVALHPPHDGAARLFCASESMDIAYPILWLTSAEANAITGINLTVDGGFTIKGIAQLDPGSSIDRAATMCEPK